jgi:hypothetical protein
MQFPIVLAIVAAACLAHVPELAAQAQGEQGAKDRPKEATESDTSKRPPIPVAKPAAVADVAKPAEGKPADGKPGDAHASPTAQLGGALPLGTGERAFNAPDCAWTGKRVINTLWREEVDAATQFTRFYSLFGCPGQHISMALSCVVAWQGDPAKSQDERVEACWADPNKPRVSTAEPPRENGKPGAEDKPPPAKN